MTRLNKMEGIGPQFAERLAACGCRTHIDLLEQGGTAAGRRRLARATGLSPQQILDWVSRADLTRVKGIGEEYADLLEAAGVDTVPELAQRAPVNLHRKLCEVNDAQQLVRVVPSLGQVQKWIMGARALPRAIYH